MLNTELKKRFCFVDIRVTGEGGGYADETVQKQKGSPDRRALKRTPPSHPPHNQCDNNTRAFTN